MMGLVTKQRTTLTSSRQKRQEEGRREKQDKGEGCNGRGVEEERGRAGKREEERLESHSQPLKYSATGV